MTAPLSLAGQNLARLQAAVSDLALNADEREVVTWLATLADSDADLLLSILGKARAAGTQTSGAEDAPDPGLSAERLDTSAPEPFHRHKPSANGFVFHGRSCEVCAGSLAVCDAEPVFVAAAGDDAVKALQAAYDKAVAERGPGLCAMRAAITSVTGGQA